MQQYILAGCCQDVRHVANRLDRGYQENQKQQLALLTRHLKAFLFNNRRANCRVVDVAQDLAGFDNSDMWCIDPVHLIDQVYRRIASGVLQMASNQTEHEERSAGKRRRPEGAENENRQPRRSWEYEDKGRREYEDRSRYGDRDMMEERYVGYEGNNRRPREYDYSRQGRDSVYDLEEQRGRGGRFRGPRGSRGGYSLYKRGYNCGGGRPY
jgi:hypothetical protein